MIHDTIPREVLDAIGWLGALLLTVLHLLLIHGLIKPSSPLYIGAVLVGSGMLIAPVLMRATLSHSLILLSAFILIRPLPKLYLRRKIRLRRSLPRKCHVLICTLISSDSTASRFPHRSEFRQRSNAYGGWVWWRRRE